MEEKLKILKNVLGSCYQNGSEYLFYCSKCKHHKKKLSVNIEKNTFKCWVCDYASYNIRTLVKGSGTGRDLIQWDDLSGKVDLSEFDLLFEERSTVEDEQRVSLPSEMVSLTSSDLPYSAIYAKNYLKDRGITSKDIMDWKIGFCSEGDYAGRLIVPSFGLSGHANYFVARSYNNQYPPYLNPSVSKNIIFNELFVDFDDDVILVEGVFDAIVAGTNAIPLLGSSLRTNSKLMQNIIKNNTAVYLALDPDAEEKELRIIQMMMKYGVATYKINVSPYSDVGEMSKEVFLEKKNNAHLIGFDNFLSHKLRKI